MSTPRTGRKISQLPTLETASLGVYVVGISGDTTYKLTLDALEDAVINTLSASLDSRVDFLETFSSSYNQFSSSVNGQLNANSASALEFRLDELESKTGSYATTGSNSFTGAITASYFKGDGSALTNVTGALSVALLDEGVYRGGVTTFNFSGSNVVSTVAGGVALVEVRSDNTLLSTSSFNSFSASVDSRIIAATNEQSFNGLISGSSQLTASYDERYVISGSITQTTWDNIASKPAEIISSSSQIINLGFATTGSNTFEGLQHINGEIEIHSGSNPQIRLINTTTGIEYHIQNGDGGHFQMHNGTTGNLLFKFWSGSVEEGNQDVSFYSNLSVSKSIFSNEIETGRILATHITGSIAATNGVISSSAQITAFGFVSSSNTIETGSFATTGSNTFTGTIRFETVGGDEGGEIEFGVPETNTTLSTRVVADVYRDKLRIFDGNTKGVYIDLGKAPTGVAGEITYKASGFVNAGTYVELDNIKATIPTSGNRSISIATVSGTFAAWVTASYTLFSGGVAGTGASMTFTTTPQLAINWNFIGAGDTATYVITDNTNNRAYRITMVIGSSYNNNFISIERLH